MANLYYGASSYFGWRFQRGHGKYLTKPIRGHTLFCMVKSTGHDKFYNRPPLISRSRIPINIDRSLKIKEADPEVSLEELGIQQR